MFKKQISCSSDDDSEASVKPKMICPTDDEEEDTDSEQLIKPKSFHIKKYETDDDDDDDDDEKTVNEVFEKEENEIDSDDTSNSNTIIPLKVHIYDSDDSEATSMLSTPRSVINKKKSKWSLTSDDDTNSNEVKLESQMSSELIVLHSIKGKDETEVLPVSSIEVQPKLELNNKMISIYSEINLTELKRNEQLDTSNLIEIGPETGKNNETITNDSIKELHLILNPDSDPDEEISETDSISQNSLAELLEKQIVSWYAEDGLKRPKNRSKTLYDNILEQGVDISDLILNEEQKDKLDYEIANIKNLTLDDLLYKINLYE